MKIARLSEVCKIVNGGTPKSSVSEYWGGDVAWLTPAEMGKRLTPYIAETARTISRTGLANCSARQVPVGAVIMSTRAPIGHLAIPEMPMAFNQGCRGLIPNDALDTKYLYYFLWFSRHALNELGTGATFKELSNGALGSYLIPLPPLKEQRRIVAVLDEAFAAIATATANSDKNLANARELFEREVATTFGVAHPDWIQSKLGSVLRVQSGFAFRSVDYVDAGHFLVRIGNVQAGRLALKNPKYVKLDTKTAKFALRSGDILTSLTGDIGRVATLQDADLPAALNQRVARLIPKANSGVDREFLLLFLESDYFRLELEAMGHGAAQLNVSPKSIAEIDFCFPSEAQQQEVLDRLTGLKKQVAKLVNAYDMNLARLDELRRSMLGAAFSGEIATASVDAIAA